MMEEVSHIFKKAEELYAEKPLNYCEIGHSYNNLMHG